MQQSLRDAIAKIEVVDASGGRKVRSRGTGFLIADGVVLTALHVVADRKAPTLELIPGDIKLSFPGGVTAASVYDDMWDAGADWVMLRCEDHVEARPLPLADWRSSGNEFQTFGFPDANPRDGMVQTGTVENHLADLDGVPAYQLFSKQAAAGDGAPVKGLSGGPVIIDNAVVGLMRFALMNQQRKTVAGTLYACPVTLVVARAQALLPIPDPCYGLPGLPLHPLPARPFRYLERFAGPDAEVFFGRNREIRQMYDQISAPDSSSIILLFGQSGVGKSSFLDAGVLPRLSWHYEIKYLRRSRTRSLLQTLLASLLDSEHTSTEPRTLMQAWRAFERRLRRPLIVVLDQLEEIFTRPLPSRQNELDELCGALEELSAITNSPFDGRLILAFRKEWFPEIHKHLEQHGLAHGNVFLEGLDRSNVIEVVNGLNSTRRLSAHFRLNVEAGVSEMIADDLAADRGSPVAPVLQVLLTRMWDQAYADAPEAPVFSHELYRGLKQKGLMLDDFMSEQLAALRITQPGEIDSGLVLDLLAFHTTGLLTAAERDHQTLFTAYAHVSDLLPGLLQAMMDLYLLTGSVLDDQAGSTRLAHDTLALVVRQRMDQSDQPGQRAWRVLENRGKEWSGEQPGAPLDHWDLAVVENGLPGMRALRPHEIKMLSASRQLRDRRARAKKIRTWAAVAATVLIIAVAIWALFEKSTANRQRFLTELSRSTDQVANLLSTEPVYGLMASIAAVGRSYAGLKSLVRAPLQYSLNRAVNESWETNLINHGAPVNAVAMHPFGELFASAGDEGKLKLWRFPPPTTSPSPRASTAGAGDQFLIPEITPTWGLDPALVVDAHQKKINGLAFSPDGLLMATAGDDQTVRLWDLRGALVAELKGHQGPVLSVSFSLRSDVIVTGGRAGGIRVWNRRGEALKAPLLAHEGYSVTALAVAPDGSSFVSGTGNGVLQIWDLGVERSVALPISAHTGPVSALDFHPTENVFASGGEDEMIQVWNTQGKALSVFRDNESPVHAIAYREDGHAIVTGGEDHLVLLADVRENMKIGKLLSPPFKGIDGAISSLAVSARNKRIIVGSRDGTVRIADWLSSQVDLPRRPRFPTTHVTLTRDASAVTALGRAGEDLILTKWSRQQPNKAPDERRLALTKDFEIAATSRDGRVVVTVDQQSVVILDIEKDTKQALAANGNLVEALALDVDGRVLAVHRGDKLLLVNTATGQHMAQTGIAGPPLRFLAFSINGDMLAGADDQCVSLWRITENIRPGPASAGDTDGETRGMGNDAGQDTRAAPSLVLEAVVARKQAPTSCMPPGDRISALAVANRGVQLVTGSRSGKLRFWTRSERGLKQAIPIKAHNGAVSALEYRPDGKAVLSGGFSDLRLWTTEGDLLAEFSGHGQPILDVAFSSNGHIAASVGQDDTVRVWATHWREWLKIGCNRLSRHVYYQDIGLDKTSDEKRWVVETREVCKRLKPRESATSTD